MHRPAVSRFHLYFQALRIHLHSTVSITPPLAMDRGSVRHPWNMHMDHKLHTGEETVPTDDDDEEDDDPDDDDEV